VGECNFGANEWKKSEVFEPIGGVSTQQLIMLHGLGNTVSGVGGGGVRTGMGGQMLGEARGGRCVKPLEKKIVADAPPREAQKILRWDASPKQRVMEG